MGRFVVTLILLVGLALSLSALAPQLAALRLPGNQQGYEPVQPIAFSHRLHAGELQVGCLYCHAGAERSRHAGIPPAAVCMNCHRLVTATLGAVRAEDEAATQQARAVRPVLSAELRKVYDALALDAEMRPDPGRAQRPIAWVRVHAVPDFVYFDHRAHVGAAVTCQQCHGPVETMEHVRQEQPLAMGWCVNCHRQASVTGVAGRAVAPSTDCSTCHY